MEAAPTTVEGVSEIWFEIESYSVRSNSCGLVLEYLTFFELALRG